MIDHLSITTTDLDRAQAFYDAVLAALGYPRVNLRAHAIGYGVRDRGPDAPPYISVYLCTGRLEPDNRHWAFRAKSRAEVRAFYEAALTHGGTDDGPIDEGRIEEERRLMYVAITRAQRSLHLNWCKKRKRARETVVCEPSRFIPEMGLDEAPPPTPEEAPMSPKDRLASLKALLQKP